MAIQTRTETELSSVNSILGAIGQAPVTSLYIERGEVRTVTVTPPSTAVSIPNGTTYNVTTSSGGLAKGLKIQIQIIDNSTTPVTFRSSITATGQDYRVNDPVTLDEAALAGWTCLVTGLVTESTFINPEISYIYKLLMESNLDVQNEGWVFNTEQDYPLPIDEFNEIPVPENVLRLDQFWNLDNKKTDVVLRQGKLYDKIGHTYKFKPFGTTNTFRAEIIWLFPYEDLPSVFQRYITYRASVRAATQMVTNPELVKMLTTQEGMARAACMEYECNQADASMFGLPDGTTYRSYRPFQALRR
jgi:hypothetical protein